VQSVGLEAHPFVLRVARAKLGYHANVKRLQSLAKESLETAKTIIPDVFVPSSLLDKCFTDEALSQLKKLRLAVQKHDDNSVEASLVWLALVATLRPASDAGTAPWQYVLPGRRKTIPIAPEIIFQRIIDMFV